MENVECDWMYCECECRQVETIKLIVVVFPLTNYEGIHKHDSETQEWLHSLEVRL